MKWWNYQAKLSTAIADKELIERESNVLKGEIESLLLIHGKLKQDNVIEKSLLLKTRADIEISLIELGRQEQKIQCLKEWGEKV